MITIQRNGQTLGTYNSFQIWELVEKGQLHGTDLAWCAEDQSWQPLACTLEYSSLFSTGQERSPAGTAMLTTLCVLTILGSIFGIIRGYFYEAAAEIIGSSHSYWRGWAYALLNLGTLGAAIVMMLRLKAGLYIYSLFQAFYLLLIAYTTVLYLPDGGMFAVLIGAAFFVPSLVFIVLYWLPGTQRELR